MREARNVPARLEVAEPQRAENEVERPLSDHLVRDVDVALLGVLRLGGSTVQASASGGRESTAGGRAGRRGRRGRPRPCRRRRRASSPRRRRRLRASRRCRRRGAPSYPAGLVERRGAAGEKAVELASVRHVRQEVEEIPGVGGGEARRVAARAGPSLPLRDGCTRRAARGRTRSSTCRRRSTAARRRAWESGAVARAFPGCSRRTSPSRRGRARA